MEKLPSSFFFSSYLTTIEQLLSGDGRNWKNMEWKEEKRQVDDRDHDNNIEVTDKI